MISFPVPAGVVAHFTTDKIEEGFLFPEERQFCLEYEPRRALDFCRGRYCGHKCLEVFEQNLPILRGADGVPVWPNGFTGSISHTGSIAGAILAKEEHYRSIGLDIETVGRVSPDLWGVLFTDDEISFLGGHSRNDQMKMSTVLFSIKEAFFKMQYVLTGEGMEYDDLEVHLVEGNFTVMVRKPELKHFNTELIHVHTIDKGLEVVSYVLFPK